MAKNFVIIRERKALNEKGKVRYLNPDFSITGKYSLGTAEQEYDMEERFRGEIVLRFDEEAKHGTPFIKMDMSEASLKRMRDEIDKTLKHLQKIKKEVPA